MHSVYNMIVGERDAMPPQAPGADTLSRDNSHGRLADIPDLGGLDDANILGPSDVQGTTVPPPHLRFG